MNASNIGSHLAHDGQGRIIARPPVTEAECRTVFPSGGGHCSPQQLAANRATLARFGCKIDPNTGRGHCTGPTTTKDQTR